ncbi:hypothetical protein F4779DRAFT_275372 [Xylariaceae sp. FL0662B]|nr:hypothetical protein F4779DRAFT_275372 [Xylariaceae sp. FL0662B]
MAPEKDKNALTDKEMQVLALAWRCFKTQPEVDYQKLADLAGYANPRSVTNLLGVVRRKINASLAEKNGEAGEEGPPTPVKATPTPKSKKTVGTPASRKRKPKDTDAEGDADREGDPATPTPKRPRAKKNPTPMSKPVAATATAGADADADADADDSDGATAGVVKVEQLEEGLDIGMGNVGGDDGIID